MAEIPTGLMRPEQRKNDMLTDLRSMFGPARSTPRTLEEKLQSLDPKELQFVLSTTYMVKLAHGFKRNNTQPYIELIRSMYPRLNSRLQRIIAAILDDADPLRAAPDKQGAEHDKATQAVQSASDSLTPSQKAYTEPEQLELPLVGDNFLEQLVQHESSGKADAEITVKDGRTFKGLYQFGDARLSDYRKATGAKFTTQEFKEDEQLQHKVADWHIKDIDKAIDSLGDAAKDYDRNGLRSVAHLGGIGGIGGMKIFVRTKGKYDPQDELGTSLSNYYAKFSA